MVSQRVQVVEKIFSANDALAEQNRARLDQAGVFAINLMASPGAGKTTLILSTIKALAPRLRIGVVEGDTAPVTIDADKVTAAGMPAVQINTGGDCHLDAVMFGNALPQLPLETLDLVIVENVGNLICPVGFDLGQTAKVGLFSLTEGDDKAAKHPYLVTAADLILLNKVDLAPHLTFDRALFEADVRLLNPTVPILAVSATTGEGINEWVKWLGADRTV